MIPNFTHIITENIGNDIKRYVIKGVSCFICHRTDGPSIYAPFGGIYWCVNGKFMSETRTYCEVCEYSPEETVMMILKYGESLPNMKSEIKSNED